MIVIENEIFRIDKNHHQHLVVSDDVPVLHQPTFSLLNSVSTSVLPCFRFLVRLDLCICALSSTFLWYLNRLFFRIHGQSPSLQLGRRV